MGKSNLKQFNKGQSILRASAYHPHYVIFIIRRACGQPRTPSAFKARVYFTFCVPFRSVPSRAQPHPHSFQSILNHGRARHMCSTTHLTCALYTFTSRMHCCVHTGRAVSKNFLHVDGVRGCPRVLLMIHGAAEPNGFIREGGVMSVLCRVCLVFPPHVSIFGLFPVLVKCHY